MTSQKRALLIGSPYGGLRGPSNDVAQMSSTLGDLGFRVSTCCGPEATRDGILKAWRYLIEQTSNNDILLIYYSGHGGLVEAPPEQVTSSLYGSSWRYQFIVPVDFDERPDHGFGGILDLELSLLLSEATHKTQNVTVVLDCCHSGRMCRNPSYGSRAVPRQLAKVCHHDISTYLEHLKNTQQLQGKTYLNGNPHAVRIAAAATSETAWERPTAGGDFAGAMTEALCQALKESHGQEVSWKTTMLRISELVGLQFPQQHPQVEGPSTRLQFSLEHASSGALPIKLLQDSSIGIIQAGAVTGVRVGNTYSIMPFGTDVPRAELEIGTATVTRVVGFNARAEVSLRARKVFPKDGTALAFPQEEALARWPVACSGVSQVLEEAIDGSRYLRRLEPGEDTSPLLYIEQEQGSVRLLTGQSVLIASTMGPSEVDTSHAYKDLLQAAEIRARAHHLQTLQCENSKEKLAHSLAVEFGTIGGESNDNTGEIRHPIRQDGSGFLTDRDKAYISLENRATPVEGGGSIIYVSIFNINVAGKISIISASYPKGIDIPPGRGYVLGEDNLGILQGLPMSWPEGVPREKPVDEETVLVVTNNPVDIRGLATSDTDSLSATGRKASTASIGNGLLSTLEILAEQVATGTKRNMEPDRSGAPVKWDVIHIPLTLVSTTLPDPAEHDKPPMDELPWPMEVLPITTTVSTGNDSSEPQIPLWELPPPEATPGWGMLPQLPSRRSEFVPKVSWDGLAPCNESCVREV